MSFILRDSPFSSLAGHTRRFQLQHFSGIHLQPRMSSGWKYGVPSSLLLQHAPRPLQQRLPGRATHCITLLCALGTLTGWHLAMCVKTFVYSSVKCYGELSSVASSHADTRRVRTCERSGVQRHETSLLNITTFRSKHNAICPTRYAWLWAHSCTPPLFHHPRSWKSAPSTGVRFLRTKGQSTTLVTCSSRLTDRRGPWNSHLAYYR